MDPRTPPIDPRQREEAAFRAIENLERRIERDFRHRLTVAAVLVLPVLVMGIGLLMVGSQRHVLEIRAGDATLRLVSHEAPYSLDVPGTPESPDFITGGLGSVIRDHVEGTAVEPRMYDTATFARTTQVVHRGPDDATPMDFDINGRLFRLVGSELQNGTRRWLMQPGRTVEINVDALPRPVAPPVAEPVEVPAGADDGDMPSPDSVE